MNEGSLREKGVGRRRIGVVDSLSSAGMEKKNKVTDATDAIIENCEPWSM